MAEKDTELDNEELDNEEEEEYSEVEQEAMKLGWDPNFEGNEHKRAISAEEFVDRQRLYDDLRKRGKENQRLQKAVEELRQSHQVIAGQAYKRAKRELENEKRTAYEEGDTTRALEIDKEMRELDEDQKKVESGSESNEATQAAFDSFREENPWYDKDPELRGYADMIGTGIVNMNPERAQNDPESFFEEVAAQVRGRFPEKFETGGGRKKRAGNSVEGDKPGGKAGKKRSIKDLPEEAREVAKRVVETGVMTEAEYVADYYGEPRPEKPKQ